MSYLPKRKVTEKGVAISKLVKKLQFSQLKNITELVINQMDIRRQSRGQTANDSTNFKDFIDDITK